MYKTSNWKTQCLYVYARQFFGSGGINGIKPEEISVKLILQNWRSPLENGTSQELLERFHLSYLVTRLVIILEPSLFSCVQSRSIPVFHPLLKMEWKRFFFLIQKFYISANQLVGFYIKTSSQSQILNENEESSICVQVKVRR